MGSTTEHDHAAASDSALAGALGVYAAMVHRVLADPGRWLGLDEDPPPSARFPVKVLDAVRDRAFGEVTPASPNWNDKPQQDRINWWLRRITISAGLAAAAPRLAGALADRVPLQAALSASAAGLAVCATAREHGRTEPSDWVPLLARILLDRDLSVAPAEVPAAAEADDLLTRPDPERPDPDLPDPAPQEKKSALRTARVGALQAAKSAWRLARALWDLQSMLDERPRGSLVSRAVSKLPVVGVAGGWLDERGAIRKASKRTAKMLR